jgi:hypothetical protein
MQVSLAPPAIGEPPPISNALITAAAFVEDARREPMPEAGKAHPQTSETETFELIIYKLKQMLHPQCS